MVLRIIYLFIGYSNGIRVHEDDNEMPTTQMALFSTTIHSSDKLSNNKTQSLNTENSTVHGHSTTQSTNMTKDLTTQ